jgi:hypothetical protein
VRLFTRNGYDFADRFAMIVAAVENLPSGHASLTVRRSLSTPTGCRCSS